MAKINKIDSNLKSGSILKSSDLNDNVENSNEIANKLFDVINNENSSISEEIQVSNDNKYEIANIINDTLDNIINKIVDEELNFSSNDNIIGISMETNRIYHKSFLFTDKTIGQNQNVTDLIGNHISIPTFSVNEYGHITNCSYANVFAKSSATHSDNITYDDVTSVYRVPYGTSYLDGISPIFFNDDKIYNSIYVFMFIIIDSRNTTYPTKSVQMIIHNNDLQYDFNTTLYYQPMNDENVYFNSDSLYIRAHVDSSNKKIYFWLEYEGNVRNNIIVSLANVIKYYIS